MEGQILATLIPDRSGLPDMEAIVEIQKLQLNEIRGLMKQVKDSHVMVQTIAKENKYTGERNYDI